MVDEPQLLDAVEHAELVLLVFGRLAPFDIDVDFTPCGEVVLVLEFGQVAFLPNLPRQKGVACDEGHVVGVHGPEGC